MKPYFVDYLGNIRFDSNLYPREKKYRKRFSSLYVRAKGEFYTKLPFRVADYFDPTFMNWYICAKPAEDGHAVINRGIYRNWLFNFNKQGGWNAQD